MADTGGAGGGAGKRRAPAGGIGGLAGRAAGSLGQEVFLSPRPGSGKERRPASGPTPCPPPPLGPAGPASWPSVPPGPRPGPAGLPRAVPPRATAITALRL